MNTQPSLFNNSIPPYRTTSEASRAAAESVKDSVSQLEQRTWQILQKGLYTNSELAEITGASLETQKPRASELKRNGYRIFSLGRKIATVSRADLKPRSEDLMTANLALAIDYLESLETLSNKQQKTLLELRAL